MRESLDKLQERIAYTFRDPTLLERAVTHASYLQEHPEAAESNQRLEFLGDAVLQLILTEALFAMYPKDREGDLSKRRSALSKGKFLSKLSREIGLNESLLLGPSEELSGGRTRAAALEDALEALIGAIFLDSGLEMTRQVVLKLYGSLSDHLEQMQPDENPKGRLQEMVQPEHGNHAIRYEVVHVSGEDHAREYEAKVFLGDRPLGSGRGNSKKAAEEAAARGALEILKAEPA